MYVNLSGKDIDRLIEGFTYYASELAQIDKSEHSERGDLLGQALVGVLAAALHAPGDDAGGRFRQRRADYFALVRDTLRRERPALAAYLARIDLQLWRRKRDGWYNACLGRSVLQVIVDHVDDRIEPPLVEPRDLAELDAELREIGPGINALPPDAIPPGLPDSHWWWSLPGGPMQDDSEDDESY